MNYSFITQFGDHGGAIDTERLLVVHFPRAVFTNTSLVQHFDSFSFKYWSFFAKRTRDNGYAISEFNVSAAVAAQLGAEASSSFTRPCSN